METLDLITDALRSIGVLNVIESPSAEQSNAALKNLNKVIASLAEDGIDLGIPPIAAITDDIALTTANGETVQALLAKKEASDRGIAMPADVLETSINGYNRLLRQALLLAQEPASLATVSHGQGADCGYNILTG